jgi:hypothetical protein
MISKMLIAAGEANSEFSVSVSPSAFIMTTDNGSFTSPRFTVNLVGAYSEYSFKWSFEGRDANRFNVNGSDELDYCTFSTSGNQTELSARLVCEVTDTDTDETTKASSVININFGGL